MEDWIFCVFTTFFHFQVVTWVVDGVCLWVFSPCLVTCWRKQGQRRICRSKGMLGLNVNEIRNSSFWTITLGGRMCFCYCWSVTSLLSACCFSMLSYFICACFFLFSWGFLARWTWICISSKPNKWWFFFPKSMAMASNRQRYIQPAGKCQSESDSFSCVNTEPCRCEILGGHFRSG